MLITGANTNYAHTLMKVLSFTLISAVITFLLFVLMHRLISSDHVSEPPTDLVVLEGVIFEEKPSKLIIKDHIKAIEPIKTPPRIERQSFETDDDLDITTDFGQVRIAKLELSTDFTPGITDRGVRPIVRVPPRYPQTAASKGIEGWVKLSFTINEVGGVEAIEVLESEPSRIFDKAARKALSKWKYQPQIEQGQAIVRHGLSVILEFNLEH